MRNIMKYGNVNVHDPATQIPDGTKPLFDYWMRDPHICIGRDGCYYLSGTTKPEKGPRGEAWVWSDGARVWRSPDLRNWEPLGLVWNLDDGAEWMRNFQVYDPDGGRGVPPERFYANPPPESVPVKRAFWGPKIHYSKKHDNYFIVGCMNTNMGAAPDKWIGHLFGGTFILRSQSGEAQGPYELTTDFPLTNYIDAKIYEEDGTLWFIWQHGMMGRLNDRMDGLTEIVNVYEAGGFDPEPCREGVHIFKHDGQYHLVQSIHTHLIDGRTTYNHRGHNDGPIASYDAVIASSDHLHGPYGPRRTLITGGGHGNPFQDKDGNWWGCIFVCRTDKIAQSRVSFVERPALVPMRWQHDRLVVSQDGHHGA
jgi:beta-xylosidase